MLVASLSPELGQAFLALLITAATAWLHHKTQQVHVLVNARMTDALDRIAALELELSKRPPAPPAI